MRTQSSKGRRVSTAAHEAKPVESFRMDLFGQVAERIRDKGTQVDDGAWTMGPFTLRRSEDVRKARPPRRDGAARPTGAIRPVARSRGAGRPAARPTSRGSSTESPPGDEPEPPRRAARSTALSVRAARADIVLEQIRSHPELVETVEDIRHRLPRLAGWSPLILSAAIDDLVAEGRIGEAADGRLVVRHREAVNR